MSFNFFFLLLYQLPLMCFFFFLNDPAPPEIYPFPLPAALPISHALCRRPAAAPAPSGELLAQGLAVEPLERHPWHVDAVGRQVGYARVQDRDDARVSRSEEHTSELQSQSNLVCRLLLEKKKQPT